MGTSLGNTRSISDKVQSPSLRIAILIISLKNNIGRWRNEENFWKTHLINHRNVDCFFIHCNRQMSMKSFERHLKYYGRDSVFKETYTDLELDCVEAVAPGIFQKTIKALDEIGDDYDFYIRTNLSTIIDYDMLLSRLATIPLDEKAMAFGVAAPDPHLMGFPAGYGIVLNKAARALLIDKGTSDTYFNVTSPDDVVMARIFANNDVGTRTGFDSPFIRAKLMSPASKNRRLVGLGGMSNTSRDGEGKRL